MNKLGPVTEPVEFIDADAPLHLLKRKVLRLALGHRRHGRYRRHRMRGGGQVGIVFLIATVRSILLLGGAAASRTGA